MPSFHHFSKDDNKKRFPRVESVTVVMLMILLYVGGVLLIPSVLGAVERVVDAESERRLVEFVEHDLKYRDNLQDGVPRTITVRVLIKDGHFDPEENGRFLRRYSLDSFILVRREGNAVVYSAYLLPYEDPK